MLLWFHFGHTWEVMDRRRQRLWLRKDIGMDVSVRVGDVPSDQNGKADAKLQHATQVRTTYFARFLPRDILNFLRYSPRVLSCPAWATFTYKSCKINFHIWFTVDSMTRCFSSYCNTDVRCNLLPTLKIPSSINGARSVSSVSQYVSENCSLFPQYLQLTLSLHTVGCLQPFLSMLSSPALSVSILI